MKKLNKDLLIDLGPTLNQELESLATGGHRIMMVDSRVMNTDGLPTPSDTTLFAVLDEGPDVWPTTFTKDLAKHHGWTNGHAHMVSVNFLEFEMFREFVTRSLISQLLSSSSFRKDPY